MNIVLFVLWYAVGWGILLGDWYFTFRKQQQFYPWHDGFSYMLAAIAGVFGPLNFFIVALSHISFGGSRK